MSNGGNHKTTRPFPWKCGKCQHREVYPCETEYTTEVVHDGRAYQVTVPGLQVFRCRNCGETLLDEDANKRISDAFRHQAGLLTPGEIRQNRRRLALTQEGLAERLGVAKASLSRWENGWQIQQRSLDKLMRLFFYVPAARAYLVPPCDHGLQGRFSKLGTPGQELLDRENEFRSRLAPNSTSTVPNTSQSLKSPVARPAETAPAG